jgi:hypothetical protein
MTLQQHKRASTVTAMNFTEEQVTDHAQNVMRKQKQIETLEALLAAHEAMSAQLDSSDVKELKERIDAARMQLMAMRQKEASFHYGPTFFGPH